jgi:hypothetical protein
MLRRIPPGRNATAKTTRASTPMRMYACVHVRMRVRACTCACECMRACTAREPYMHACADCPRSRWARPIRRFVDATALSARRGPPATSVAALRRGDTWTPGSSWPSPPLRGSAALDAAGQVLLPRGGWGWRAHELPHHNHNHTHAQRKRATSNPIPSASLPFTL